MEYYNNILCFEAGWLIDNNIVTDSNYKKLVERKQLQQVRRACRNTPALVAYDSMPDRIKDVIKEKIKGDPYDQVTYSVLDDLIEHSAEASDFFENKFKLKDGRFIPKQTRIEYYNNAIVLDAIHTLIVSKYAKKRAMGGKTTGSWESISEAVQSINKTVYAHNLPTNARSLERKYKAYKSEGDDGGYISLIHKNFLKDRANAAKIDDDVKESVLSELFGDPRNIDNAQVARLYNQIAGQMDWQKISTDTVAVWRDKLDFVDYAGRQGSSALFNNKLMQVKRKAPEKPLYYLTLDGWDAELLYQRTENGRTTYHHRPTIVIVLDPCVKYPLGYAIGTHETPELIKQALRNALKHSAELFGNMYRTHQIQSDNYAIKAMTPIYEAMGIKVTPARARNAKAKVIEPYFNYFNKTFCQMQANWSGFGITSDKEKQPNTEYLNKYKHNFPDFKGVCEQLARLVDLERASKREAYLEAWAKLDESDKIAMPFDSYMLTFGETTGRKNLLQGSGLNVTIKGIKRTYDCFDLNFRRYASTQWSIVYDPEDTSHVLAVNDDESLRFVLEEKYIQPMALKERKEGDAEQLARINAFNDTAINYVTEQRALSGETVKELFEAHPELDTTLAKLLLTDSNGQHKNVKNIGRGNTRQINIETVDYTPVNDEPRSIYDKY